MLYTLARWRFHQPPPPFQLGGEYSLHDGRNFLRDALGAVEIVGRPDLFDGLAPGDLIVIEVGEVLSTATLRAHGLRLERKSARPGQSAPPRPHAEPFARFLTHVRRFFTDGGLHEVLTPTLVPCPGLEPSLEPFATTATRGRLEQRLYLPTSPEIHLKKAMAQGWLDIFELKTCFRRGEFSPHHANEFTMLEWYRGFADLGFIEADLRSLLARLNADGWITGGLPEVTVTDFAALFREHLEFDLTPATTATELRALCARWHVHTADDDTFDDLFHRLLLDHLESKIATAGPVIIRQFPPSQAALAKLDHEGWADRFEFYWNGLEIANAFNEVNDPVEQKRRWDGEQTERARLGTSPLTQDPELISALARGIPSSGGIALGVERLYMACTGVREIRELRLFSSADGLNNSH